MKLMTKLLEFNPETQKESEVSKLVTEDLWFSCTPDMPALRFAKTIPVFIWDEMKTYKSIEDTLGITSSEYKVISYLSFTKEKFLPFFNNGVTKQDYFLPASPTWNKSLKEATVTGEPKQVSGRILHVSLYALRVLDLYYNNTVIHQRHKMRFVSQGRNLKESLETQAWVYMLPTTSFTKYHPHEGEYRLTKGFDPTNCNVNDQYHQPEGAYTSVYKPVGT
jgi:hypothetical protein